MAQSTERSPEGVIAHIQRRIGPIHTTYQEILSDDLVIDIHHIKSTLFRRFEILVTSGMSAKPMTVPSDYEGPRYAEALVILPKDWRISPVAFGDEKCYWPIRMLKDIARFVHHGKTWVGFGHTMANGASEGDTKPYAPNTKLCALLLVPPLTLDKKAWSFERKNGDEVFFWAAVPLHMDELKFKMSEGVDALLDLFDRAKVSDRIDPARPPVVSQR